MTAEQMAINDMFAAYQKLRALGWNDAVYCPKDGTVFETIEAGSTGIHCTHYSGQWPDGSWWVHDAGDLWPSRPILFRLIKDASVRDRSGEAGETTVSPEGKSPADLSATPSPHPHPQAPNTLSEVEEAKALLAELDCLDGSPASHAERLRCRASVWAFGGNVLKAKQANAKADRIEAALATLRASQEQDSEVRHG